MSRGQPAFVVPGQLEIVALACIPTAPRPIPDQESSQDPSAQSTRSYEGIAHPAKPSAAFAGSCENAELIPMLRGVGGLTESMEKIRAAKSPDSSYRIEEGWNCAR
jgi:hypothetical protein